MKYVVDCSDIIVWSEIPRALGVISLIILHIVVLGYWGMRATKFHPASFWATAAVGAGLGYTLLGLEMVTLGYFHALSTIWLGCSSGIMLAAVALIFPRLRELLQTAVREIRLLLRDDKLIAVSAIVMLLLVVVSGLRPPREIDERQYHWAAPLMWADYGGWVQTPFHNTNGPALGEMIYTFSAIFGAPIAAHWTHFLCLLTLLASAAALAESLGASKVAILGACLAIPVVVNQTSLSYTDTAAGALVLAAYVPLFCHRKSEGLEVIPWGAIAASSLLFVGAVSVKSYTLAGLPFAALYVLCRSFPGRDGAFSKKLMALGRPLLLSLPVFATLSLWMVHTYILTGHWDSRKREIESMTVHSSNDVRWRTGEAVARVPSAKDILGLPLIPAITPIIGQMEPFGGRSGLLLYFAPFGLCALPRLTQERRSRALWLLGAAAVYFLGLAAVAVKTRYHIFTWVCGSCFSCLAYGIIRDSVEGNIRRIGLAAFYLVMWAGMADVAHVLLRKVTPFY